MSVIIVLEIVMVILLIEKINIIGCVFDYFRKTCFYYDAKKDRDLNVQKSCYSCYEELNIKI